ncbi:hypothetical protein FBU30_008534 [Linnemannia zychae]|nr:hypothetical protein FBU30_008534 [Linnemannia zychae]
MFNGFSAWFAPELHSYKQTWTRHGGEEKEIADADIAFVTDKTASGEASLKPTMKILRPDWIEDSIRGRRRLSLKRYKSVFPGLERFESDLSEVTSELPPPKKKRRLPKSLMRSKRYE